MALNSFTFLLLFLPAVIAGVMLLRDRVGPRAAQWVVLAASLLFYSLDGVRDLSLLLGSITFNWWVATKLSEDGRSDASRKRWLTWALVADVGVLCLFKYARAVETAVGIADVTIDLGFPLGLSFFTLTQVMYLVDCYERLVPARGWVDHATFVSFFPNVTAGPLLRAKLFYRQLEALGSAAARSERFTRGATLVLLGLAKKVVLGDTFAEITRAGYTELGMLSTLGAWVTVLSGTLEIYFDFSGYSDMAYGCAELMGLQLQRNFNVPYRALNISDFWRRWHISLSDFITTYLYTPLLKRMGKATIHKSALATLVAMLIAGFWHGATWNFILFGALHGSALAVFQYWKRLKRPLPKPVAWLVTFVFVSVTFITVHSPDLSSTIRLVGDLVSPTGFLDLHAFTVAIPASDLRIMALPVLFGVIAAFVGPKAEELALRPKPGIRSDAALIALLLLAYVFMSGRETQIFRYRQF